MNENMLDRFELPAGTEFVYPTGLRNSTTRQPVVMDPIGLAKHLRAICRGKTALLARWAGILVCLGNVTEKEMELLLDDITKAMKLPKKVARSELLSAIADRNAAREEAHRLMLDADEDAVEEVVEDVLERDALDQIDRLKRSRELYTKVKHIADDPLGEFDRALSQMGVVGERPAAITVFLAAHSAHSTKPFSVAVKGQSSTGKSFTTKAALMLSGTYIMDVSSLSAKAIIYDVENAYVHRTIFLEEGEVLHRKDGEKNDVAEMLRLMLSEGRLAHATVERDPDTGRLTTRRLVQEGPTNLITTTTRGHLDSEIETRMLSVWLDESEDQSRRIMASIAAKADGSLSDDVDFSVWDDFAEYVRLGPNKVRVPFSKALSVLLPATAVRSRRDIDSILSLVRASAMIHRASRKVDAEGRLVAQMGDYEVALECIGDAVAEAHGLKLSDHAEAFLGGLRDKLIKPACEALEHPDGTKGKTCWDDAAQRPYTLAMPPSGPSMTLPPRTMNSNALEVTHASVNGVYVPTIQASERALQKALGVSRSSLQRYRAHVAAEGLIEYVDQNTPRHGRKSGAFYLSDDAWDALNGQGQQTGLPTVAEIEAEISGIF